MRTRIIGMLSALLVLAPLVVACGASPVPDRATDSYQVEEVKLVEQESASGTDQGGSSTSSLLADQGQVERMIIWTADLLLLVKDAQEGLDRVQATAKDLGGYTVSSESWLENEQLHARVTIRVPAQRFEDAMSRLRGLALKVNRESANSQDVTDEYVDLEARLRHLDAKEAQLLEFLDRAEDTEATLAVYEQLAQTQLELEQVKGRMAYLEKLSAMATINVELAPEEAAPAVIEEGWRPGRTLRQAARALVSTLEGLGNAIIWVAIYVLPILLLLAIPVVLLLWLVRRRRRRQHSPEA